MSQHLQRIQTPCQCCCSDMQTIVCNKGGHITHFRMYISFVQYLHLQIKILTYFLIVTMTKGYPLHIQDRGFHHHLYCKCSETFIFGQGWGDKDSNSTIVFAVLLQQHLPCTKNDMINLFHWTLRLWKYKIYRVIMFYYSCTRKIICFCFVANP